MKVAIITYCYSDKSNTVSGLRLESWARALAQKGIDVTVFTRDWQWGDGSASLLLESAHYDKEIVTCQDNIKIVYLPYKKNWYSQPTIFKKLVDTVMALAGRYASEADISQWFAPINKYLQKEKYTHVISSCHPYTTLLLTHKLQKNNPGSKFIVDFRDYYNNHLLKTKVDFSPLSTMIMNVQARWITHYIKDLDKVITASESITEKFATVHRFSKAVTILNGYESDIFDQLTPETDSGYFFPFH